MNFKQLSTILNKTYLLTTLLTTLLIAASNSYWLSNVASADSPPPAALSVHQQVSGFYQQLTNAARYFQQSSLELCQSPSTAKFTVVQNHWRQLMNSWMIAEVINFGPVQQGNMAWRFQFWPDKKNLIKRKVEGFLAAHSQPSTIATETVKTSSVLVQGLSAAEYLLFDPQLKTTQQVINNPQRCQMLASISANLFANAQQLEKSWQTETATNKPTVEESISQLLNGMATLIERSHKKLVMPLGKQKANPYFSESWRSQHSIENIKHNLISIKQLYQVQLKPLLLEKKQGNLLAEKIDQQFNFTFKLLGQFKQSLFVLLKHQQLEQTTQLAQSLKQLKQLFSQQLPDKLGVIISFNANDGD
ncbi:imelysin family protein [Endozoicomonas sp. SM1973]|uniref:Imelysin family protein n=1 Tax=Spartinivicinus marinus TaxID=2994442 RepID=A0A853IGM7_9GAMM|nr:imelysin family protein [Spartinivicinus marinus]MCX4028374.1 imelysin family protein [Spartinivicinus marinus]NYZ68627.1 imelysin family protein [Spartinivicinus marinus]